MAQTYRYWRVYSWGGGSPTSTFTALAEIEMRGTAGGADLTGAGTAIASGFVVGQEPAKAYDNNTTTSWQGSGASHAWVGYDFGAATTVAQLALTSMSVSSYAPVNFAIQASDDGTAWITLAAYTTTSWSSGITRTFTVPDPPATTATIPAAGVYALTGTGVGVAASTAAAFAVDFRLEMRKAVGYAAINHAPADSVTLRKAAGYAVISSAAELTVRKALGYAVIDDGSLASSARRRPLILPAG